MADFYVKVNNVDEVKALLEQSKTAILKACGVEAQGQAVLNITRNGTVESGRLRSSIEYEVDDDTMIVGTNVEYAPYIEMGTGIYAEEGGHGGGWWVYVKGGGKSGKQSHKRYSKQEAARIVAMLRDKGLDAHMTEGQRPKPFLRPALKDHTDIYKTIIEDGLKNGK